MNGQPFVGKHLSPIAAPYCRIKVLADLLGFKYTKWWEKASMHFVRMYPGGGPVLAGPTERPAKEAARQEPEIFTSHQRGHALN
jgi:hypothetical protein